MKKKNTLIYAGGLSKRRTARREILVSAQEEIRRPMPSRRFYDGTGSNQPTLNERLCSLTWPAAGMVGGWNGGRLEWWGAGLECGRLEWWAAGRVGGLEWWARPPVGFKDGLSCRLINMKLWIKHQLIRAEDDCRSRNAVIKFSDTERDSTVHFYTSESPVETPESALRITLL
ncbi:hypothetical protein Baya_15566 [Bagarius yarrelli]|uniref:Uncharacterized protein n=1 Tax=Bagarius yarrelli TaxID=175774 RepID=A0A556VC13_BAGYA|nr:hypothetical protein Baya_15566 [Bagarius yarrelli]